MVRKVRRGNGSVATGPVGNGPIEEVCLPDYWTGGRDIKTLYIRS
jgi:hypothetical protein